MMGCGITFTFRCWENLILGFGHLYWQNKHYIVGALRPVIARDALFRNFYCFYGFSEQEAFSKAA